MCVQREASFIQTLGTNPDAYGPLWVRHPTQNHRTSEPDMMRPPPFTCIKAKPNMVSGERPFSVNHPSCFSDKLFPVRLRQIATTLIFTIAVACNFSSWMHHVGAAQWYTHIRIS